MIKSFEEWFNSHEFNSFKTGSHKERCEIAWNARQSEIDSLKAQLKEKDEQIEKMRDCRNCNYLKIGVCKASRACKLDEYNNVIEYDKWEIR